MDVLTQYFTIYPLTGMNIRHSILLGVTIRASDHSNQFSFQIDSPPKLKRIQSIIAKFNESIHCPPEVTHFLQMPNKRYDLDNLGYVCLKVLGYHHASYASSAHFEGFGMTVGCFSFLALKSMIILGYHLFMITW